MTSLTTAREKAGLSLEIAAKRAGCSVDYLRRIERGGGCAYPLAMRIARLYGISLNTFLSTNQGKADAQARSAEKRRNIRKKRPASRAK